MPLDSTLPIRKALIAVYEKEGILELAKVLVSQQVMLFATTGTAAYLKKQGIAATSIDSLTHYPDLLSGRVKTLHPKVFGGLLARNKDKADEETLGRYDIPRFDLLIANLYPFEAAYQAQKDTLSSTSSPTVVHLVAHRKDRYWRQRAVARCRQEPPRCLGHRLARTISSCYGMAS